MAEATWTPRHLWSVGVLWGYDRSDISVFNCFVEIDKDDEGASKILSLGLFIDIPERKWTALYQGWPQYESPELDLHHPTKTFFETRYGIVLFPVINVPPDWCQIQPLLLSGVPDLWDRNKILRGGDLSHLHVPDCIWVFFSFLLFVFIHHNFQFYFELYTFCNTLDIYLL